jgi:type I restriction enzyme S subunit
VIFKPFKLYKKCSFELIDSIPDHWSDERIKFSTAELITGGTPDSGNESYWCESGAGTPWVSITDMTKCSLVKETEKDVTSKGIAAKGLKLVPRGSILYSIFASLGKVAEASVDLVTNQAILAFTTKPHLDKSFLRYWLLSVEKYLMYFSTSNTQNNLNLEKVKNLPIFIPSSNEQIKIVGFLDHETAKIDALIEKQQRLIELLKEKRQAVISHAVTKGLNPNAPMKDSRVEWLGEVPAHWVVTQLKFNTLEMQTGPFGSQLHADDYVEDGIPLVNPAHMINGLIVPDKKVTVDEKTWQRLSRHQLKCGDLIFARRGELGRCAVVNEEQEGWLCGTGSLKAKLNERLTPEYSYLLITSDGVVAELSLESKGSTMDNLNTETLGRIRLPIPPTEEQQKIIEYVHAVSGKFQKLVDKADSAIALIRERRTALISAAVTGKIDVRDWQAAA